MIEYMYYYFNEMISRKILQAEVKSSNIHTDMVKNDESKMV